MAYAGEENWSGRPGSNRRHPAWEAGVLPLNYSRPVGDKRIITCHLRFRDTPTILKPVGFR